MRKIYSLVLMATMLLVGANSWAGKTYSLGQTDLQSGWPNNLTTIRHGDRIELTEDVTPSVNLKPLVIYFNGTENLGDHHAADSVVTINLNGHNLNLTNQTGTLINLLCGTLNIVNEVNGQPTQNGGQILAEGATALIQVFGYGDGSNFLIHKKPEGYLDDSAAVANNPGKRTAVIFPDVDANDDGVIDAGMENVTPGPDEYSVLNIGENVKITAKKQTVYITGALKKGQAAFDAIGQQPDYNNYFTTLQDVASGRQQALGVHVNINGNIYSVEDRALSTGGNLQDDRIKLHPIPRVTIQDNKEIFAGCGRTGNEGYKGIYAAGYAIWNIGESHVKGSVGLYAKAGKFIINGATIESCSEDYKSPVGTGGGTNSYGGAIVVESNFNYGSAMNVVIIDVTATSQAGPAVIETVTTTNTGSHATGGNFHIDGGTFSGDPSAGAINISAELTGDIDFQNGGITGGNFNSDISEYIGNVDGIITPIYNEETGETTYTVSQIPGGETGFVTYIKDGEGNYVANDSYVKLTGTSVDIDGNANLQLKYLMLTAATSPATPSIVTVKTGSTLKVEEIVIDATSQIIVEKGAYLIVNGSKGIVAFNNNNLKVETAEGNPAYVLLSPQVVTNRHPHATVEFASKSVTISSTNYIKQRFGIPTIGQLDEILAEDNIATGFEWFNYETGHWETIGYINYPNPGDNTMVMSKMANPFDYYRMQSNTTVSGKVYTMKGELVGNDNPTIIVRLNSWNGYANSYTGNMSVEKLFNLIPSTVDKALYLFNVEADYATWEPATALELEGTIAPLQPFLIHSTNNDALVEINYAKTVYNPMMGIADPDPAPARQSNSYRAMAKIIVQGENCKDRVIVAADDQFTADFDNGYDAVKYMNEGINFYVMANEKMSNYATNNLSHTYLGFASLNGGEYTMSFEKLQGEELVLIDHITGQRIIMNESATYTFTANQGEVNDYRFEIVGRQEMPTDIEEMDENPSAMKIGSVYTVLGQYVGQISDWDKLPTGMYVVDGVKRMK